VPPEKSYAFLASTPRYEDGAIVGLMREALVRSMAAVTGVATDGHSELWLNQPLKKVRQGDLLSHAHESVVVFLRRVDGTQYAVLKPSIKVLDAKGAEVSYEIAGPVKSLLRTASSRSADHPIAMR
jgi:hypothetical protein